MPSVTASSSPDAAWGQAKCHSEKFECLLPSPMSSVEVLLRCRRGCSPGTRWLSINPSIRSVFQDRTQDMKIHTVSVWYIWLCGQNLKTSLGTCVKMQYGMLISLKVEIWSEKWQSRRPFGNQSNKECPEWLLWESAEDLVKVLHFVCLWCFECFIVTARGGFL